MHIFKAWIGWNDIMKGKLVVFTLSNLTIRMIIRNAANEKLETIVWNKLANDWMDG